MQDQFRALAETIAQRFSLLPEVRAVALAGSQATGVAGEHSDIDVYIYTDRDIPASVRQSIGAEFSDHVEVADFWGPGTEWDDRATGIHVDTIYFGADWMEDQLNRVLVRHEASLGYSTCFWHTVRVSQILFDRNGWFAALQARAMQDYPEPLVKAIVAHNTPVLRQIFSSYLRQLEKAASRGDKVSLNHRTAALLASYFDIVFAVNRLPHPGEKRLLEYAEKHCARLPENMRGDITALLAASVYVDTFIGQFVNQLVDHLDEWLREAGFLVE